MGRTKNKSKKAAPASATNGATPTKPAPAIQNGSVTKPAKTSKGKNKKVPIEVVPEPEPEKSESESDSESESETEAAPVLASTNGAAKGDVDVEDSSDASEDEEDSEEFAGLGTEEEESGSEGEESDAEEESSEEESDVEEQPKVQAAPKVNEDEDSGSEEESSSEEGSDEESDAEEEAKVEAPSKKRKAEADPEVSAKKVKTDLPDGATAKKVKTDLPDGATAKLFVGNLSWAVDDEMLAREFDGFGTIVSAGIVVDRQNNNRSKGFGYVNFERVEDAVAALEAKNGADLEGRPMNVDYSQPKEYQQDPKATLKRSMQYGDKLSDPSDTLFVGNLSFDATQDDVREAFGEFGEITRVAVPTDINTGAPKGFAYVSFSSKSEARQALDNMQGGIVGGRPVRLDFAKGRDNAGGRGGFGGRGGRGGFGDRGGRGGFGGRGGRGGRGGFGGRGGGFQSKNRGGVGEARGSRKTFD